MDAEAKAGKGDPALEPMVFDTAALPLAEQLPAFVRSSPNSRITRVEDGPFLVHSTMWPLDEMLLAEIWIDPIVSTRDERQIQAHPADHYMAIVPLSGTIESEIGGIRSACGPGQILINDYSRPFVTISPGAAVIALTISRAFLDDAAGGAHAHGVLPSNGETRILIDFLASLRARLPQLRMTGVPILSRIIRDLLATAIRSGDPVAPTVRSNDIRTRVRRHIAALPPGEIDLAALMADLSLSRSSLFRAFRPEGGVLAYDRQRRLRMLHRLLLDRAETRGIGDLGFACGFRDFPYLSRLFRASYGYTMSDLRGHTHDVVTPFCVSETAASGERYRAFVSSLY